jgi:hypothetical protein
VLFAAGMAWEQHLEVVVELKPGADPVPVVRWLEQHGLATLPLVVGVLAAGTAETFRAAFGAEPTGTMPVPEELSELVASIVVVPPKQLHENQ